MFYTKIARVISAIILFLGISRILMGIFVITSETPKLAAARLLGTHTSGEAIDKGFLYILIAVTLGVLVEISISVQKKSQENSKVDQKILDT